MRHRRTARLPRPALLGIVGGLAALIALTITAVTRQPTASTGRAAAPPAVTSSASSPAAPGSSSGSTSASAAARTSHAPAPPAPWTAAPRAGVVARLAPGSHPSALPYDLLIVDKLNNRLIVVDPQGRIRWQFPRPGDLRRGQTFLVPDDAFFSPDGRYIVATEEDDSVVSVIDIARHRIIYRYGIPGRPGSGPNRLSNPDDAMMLPDGYLLMADIKNCRMILVAPGTHRPAHVVGTTTTDCYHAPPQHWGSPNGIFAMRNGHYLVTEINGDWVDEITPAGSVRWSAHPPGVAYPSDSNEIAPNRYLTADYSYPGQVVVFNRAGRSLWRYSGSGAGQLNHPSLALPLPNGDIAVSDDYDHRVVVIDPHTNRIVWQYGVTRVAGAAPGYLNNPDGLDIVPPHSFLGAQASTIGAWPVGGSR